jgi:hypothetical protein
LIASFSELVGRNSEFRIPNSEFDPEVEAMKSKNLIILALIVVAVGAYIMLVERHRPTSDEVASEVDKVLQGFDRDEVTGIVIERDSGRVRLEKVGEAWRLREPVDFAADESAVSSTLGTLANLEAERRLAVDEVDPAAYGLDDPPIEIRLRTGDGIETVVEVGNEIPLRSKRALRIAGADEIVVVPGWFVSDLEREVDDWRSREVVDISEDQVASIEIGAGEDRIRAVRLKDRWQLLEPLQDLAGRDHLRNLVRDLDSLRIEEFLDDPVDPADLGLDVPEYEITLIRTDGGEPLRLDLGSTREGDSGTEVACRRGDGEFFWASEKVRTRLSKAPVLWRSKKVMPFETWDVEGLRLSRGGDAVELEQVDGLWRLAEDFAEADYTAVQDRLRMLADLEATDYDLMAPMTAETGRAEVALKAADDEAEGRVVSFQFFEPLAQGGRAMVRVGGRDSVMGVEVANVDAILGDFERLRPNLPAQDVADGE